MDNLIIIVVYICILILKALCIARNALISIAISTVRQHFHFCAIVEIINYHARGIVYWASWAPLRYSQ